MCDEPVDSNPYHEYEAEIFHLRQLLCWAYSKLRPFTFSSMEDAMRMDEMKSLLSEEK